MPEIQKDVFEVDGGLRFKRYRRADGEKGGLSVQITGMHHGVETKLGAVMYGNEAEDFKRWLNE